MCFSSLYSVSTLVGLYSGKVVDFITKSTYCKACKSWNKRKNLEKYIKWKHNQDEECITNHVGSAGKMEVDAIKEMAGLKNYIALSIRFMLETGIQKSSRLLLSLIMYDCEVKKKECIGHVQKNR